MVEPETVDVVVARADVDEEADEDVALVAALFMNSFGAATFWFLMIAADEVSDSSVVE